MFELYVVNRFGGERRFHLLSRPVAVPRHAATICRYYCDDSFIIHRVRGYGGSKLFLCGPLAAATQRRPLTRATFFVETHMASSGYIGIRLRQM